MKTTYKYLVLRPKGKSTFLKKNWVYVNYGTGDRYEWNYGETKDINEAEHYESLDEIAKDYNVAFSVQQGEYNVVEVTERQVVNRKYKKIAYKES